MARRRLWRNDVVRSYWRTRHPLLRFLCLHEAVILPFVVAISDPTYLLRSPSALRRLPQWNFVLLAVKCHGISPLSTAVHAIHHSLWPAQISKTNYMFRVHACGLWDLNVICENLRLITLRSQLEVCEKESCFFFPVALRRPPRLLANPRPLVNPQPGVRMFSSRRRRVSRQASPFLSLPHQSMWARIHRLNSRMIICFLARGHVILFPSG